jgi:HEAT repeat protein
MSRPRPRLPHAARLIALGLGCVCFLWACGPKGEPPASVSQAPVSAPLDLEAARAVLVTGTPEESQALVASLVAAEPPPLDWLRQGLQDENRNVREWCAHALGDLAPNQPDIIEALRIAFEDEDDWVRWKAARALGNIGPAAQAALPALEKAAADVREEVVHAAAVRAVQQIRGTPDTPNR